MYKLTITKHEKIILLFYLIVFTAVALTVALLQPNLINPPVFSNPPDEMARYLVPKWICDYGTLPTGLEPETKIQFYGESSYAFLPGLSYIVMGYLMRLVQTGGGNAYSILIIARCVNVLFGILTAFFIWLLARRIFEEECFVWLFSVAVTFLPQHLFIHTYVNTESMCMLSIAVVLHSLVRMRQDAVSYSNSVEFALGASMLTLSYYNAYGVLLFSIPIFLSYFIKKNDKGYVSYDIQSATKYACLIIIIWAVLSLWWFIREGIVLDGDFLGMVHRDKAQKDIGMIPLSERGITFFDMLREYRPFSTSKVSFIAAYGAMSIITNIWVYRIYEIFYLLGLILAIPVMINEIKMYKSDRVEREGNENRILFHIMLFLADLTTIALWLYYCYFSDFQAQGRYLFPLLFHFYWIVIKGYEKAIKAFSPRMETVICTGLCVCILVILISYVYGTAVPVYIND